MIQKNDQALQKQRGRLNRLTTPLMHFLMIKTNKRLFLKKLARNYLDSDAMWWVSILLGGNQALRKCIRGVDYPNKKS